MPLILIPGIASDATVWEGMPEGQVMTSGAETVLGMARDILARAPARFALAGHSMGGYVALAIVTLAPERVERPALLSTSAACETGEQKARRGAIIDAARADYAEVVELLLPAMMGREARADHALYQNMRAMLLRAGRDTFLRHQVASLGRLDRGAMLPGIAGPTLILHGEDDRVVAPLNAAETAAAIPGATLTILQACGHMPQRERPTETRAAITAWLRRAPSARH